MEPNRFTRLGAVRSAMRCIGQAPQQQRWADLAHQRPDFWACRTSLRPTCGQSDHGV